MNALSRGEVHRDAQTSARIHLAGSAGLLLDVESGGFDMQKQQRLWTVAQALSKASASLGTHDIVLGMNNLMVLFDPSRTRAQSLAVHLMHLWSECEPLQRNPRSLAVEVAYGGAVGVDLEALAHGAGLDVTEYVRLHSESSYSVACLGSMAGFPYLAGLPSTLAAPRRSVPRKSLSRGAVIVGGLQASILPATGPCGWHVLGSADISLFDAHQSPPCRLGLGDTVRFKVKSIESIA